MKPAPYRLVARIRHGRFRPLAGPASLKQPPQFAAAPIPQRFRPLAGPASLKLGGLAAAFVPAIALPAPCGAGLIEAMVHVGA